MQDNKKIITVKCLYCFYVNAIWAVRLQCVHILHWIIKLPACLFNLFTSLLIYSLKTGPFLFKARGHKRQPNLALVFFVFIWCCSIFCCGCTFAFVVFHSVFSTKPTHWLVETSLKWPSLTQWINQSFMSTVIDASPRESNKSWSQIFNKIQHHINHRKDNLVSRIGLTDVNNHRH